MQLTDDTREALLSSILEIAADAIIVIDLDQRIRLFNRAAERTFGYRAEEVLGRPLDILLPTGAVVPHNTHIHRLVLEDAVRRPMTERLPVAGRCKDGTEFPAEVGIAKVTHQGQEMLVAILHDISLRRRAEDELRESEARYRSLFENSIEGVLLTTPDGAILTANPEACRLLGRNEEELRELNRAEIVDLTDPRLADALAEQARVGRVRYQLTFLRRDGTPFPVEMSAGLFRDANGEDRSSVVFRDITERIQAHQWLEESVAERTSAIRALLEVSRNVASGLELNSLLSTILTQLGTAIDCTGAGIAVLEDGTLRILDYRGPTAREKLLNRAIPLDRDSAYLQVVTRGEPVIVEDCWADTPGISGGSASFSGEMLSLVAAAPAWLGVPLSCDGNLIGVLWQEHLQPGHFNEEHAQLAKGFAELTALAIDNARLYGRAQQAAALEERQKLARDLHDSVSQSLYGIVLGTRTARAHLEGSNPIQARQALEYVLSLAEAAFADMRALIFELRPDALETDGLIAAISRQIDELRNRHDLIVEPDLAEEPAVPLDVKEALYRIAQEALNNIAKHAQARHVALRLTSSPGGVSLEISDDGQGFGLNEPQPGHLGVLTMRERAEGLGGSFKIESLPAQGTRIRVWIPGGPLRIPRWTRGAALPIE